MIIDTSNALAAPGSSRGYACLRVALPSIGNAPRSPRLGQSQVPPGAFVPLSADSKSSGLPAAVRGAPLRGAVFRPVGAMLLFLSISDLSRVIEGRLVGPAVRGRGCRWTQRLRAARARRAAVPPVGRAPAGLEGCRQGRGGGLRKGAASDLRRGTRRRRYRACEPPHRGSHGTPLFDYDLRSDETTR